MSENENELGGSKDYSSDDKPAEVSKDDSHKVEKLAKAGRDDLDTDAGSD